MTFVYRPAKVNYYSSSKNFSRSFAFYRSRVLAVWNAKCRWISNSGRRWVVMTDGAATPGERAETPRWMEWKIGFHCGPSRESIQSSLLPLLLSEMRSRAHRQNVTNHWIVSFVLPSSISPSLCKSLWRIFLSTIITTDYLMHTGHSCHGSGLLRHILGGPRFQFLTLPLRLGLKMVIGPIRPILFTVILGFRI